MNAALDITLYTHTLYTYYIYSLSVIFVFRFYFFILLLSSFILRFLFCLPRQFRIEKQKCAARSDRFLADYDTKTQ